MLSIRPAARADLPLIAQFIRDLAEYEKLSDAVRFDEAVMGEKLFGANNGHGPYAEVVIGEVDGEAQGFALFFHNFSTFEGLPGIYLEDLFVRPEARGAGLGSARLEWSVLDWNAPAIGFYEKLGARGMDEWTVMRLDGANLAQLGAVAGSPAD
jgi:GNAT superfamily N-acetyltransferase